MVDEKITGLMVYYYFVCKKKLWLFGNGLEMEEESELVYMGKVIDETSYQSERKHIMINEEINIDFIENAGVIHEIKKSRKVEQASIWQVKYYLYYLKNRIIRIVPEWNVKTKKCSSSRLSRSIRIVPEWNVKL